MSMIASTTVDLARIQFATTSLYHFLFVPLTLGLAPLVALMHTFWHRSGDEAWLRLTRFFGTLMLINFAIGVATGLVQEFQFGMNWSIYSAYVGDVFGAPLAIEGLAAFFLESTFLGLWIFGWNRLSPRVHLATAWLFALGSWLSAYFIIVANSWMQRPVGSTVSNGRAELTDIWELLGNRFAIYAFVHVILVGITTAATVMFGVACWHLLRGRNIDLFKRAAKLALIVLVPVSAVNLGVGSYLGEVVTELPADEDRGHRGAMGHLSAVRLLALSDRRLHRGRPDTQILDPDSVPALVPGHRLLQRRGPGHDAAAVAGGATVRLRATTGRPSRPPTGACG